MSTTSDDMAARQALKAAKKDLRTVMKTRLSGVSEKSVSIQSMSTDPLESQCLIVAGSAVFKQVTQLQSYRDAKRIGIYLSMPSAEIQTDAIVRDALQSGKKVFVPYLYKHPNPPTDTPKSIMDMVDLRSLSDYTSLERDSWGIPTINSDTVGERERILGDSAEDASPDGLDMILMPGVAFEKDSKTEEIKRLGHGKGFYDYFMHRYLENRRGEDVTRTSGPDVYLIGLALKEQYLNPDGGLSIPVGNLDHRLDGLVVGSEEVVESNATTP